MKCHQTEQSRRTLCGRDIHIPKGVYCLLVLDRLKVSKFQNAKTSANKRFYNMSAKLIAQFRGAKLLHFFDFCKSTHTKIYKNPPPMSENINGGYRFTPKIYNTFNTCSLICSRISFIFTTMICISLWLLLLPSVLISRPISCAIKPSFLPTPAPSLSMVSRKYFK